MEGLESIFFELYPFGIALKRQQVQDYYTDRFNSVTPAQLSVARGELKRNFNTRANQVRNLVDSAESLGDVTNKLNLIIAATSLPDERTKPADQGVMSFCDDLILKNIINTVVLDKILISNSLKRSEARLLLACAMFCDSIEIEKQTNTISIQNLLGSLITMVKTQDLLPRNDPFFTEALCFLEGMSNFSPIDE